MYEKIIKELKRWLEPQDDFILNSANLSAVLFHNIINLNWVGIYMRSGNKLYLGPFQGKPARQIINIGDGVCGVSAEKKETMLVEDVHQFPGHIACDLASNSEIVVPIIKDNILYGVLDIDSPHKFRFIEEEKQEYESYVEILIQNSDMDRVKKYYNI